MRTIRVLVLAVLGGVIGVIVPGTALAGPAGQTASGGGAFVPAPLPAGRGPAAAAPLAPTNTIKEKGSLNWSGYVQSAKSNVFTSVVGSWRVPTVSTSQPGLQVSSDWVGIGGFKDTTLVQAGTTANNQNGTAVYQAWTEILPAAEVPLSMTVNPGDSITTLVKETSPGTWLMQVTDNTSAVTQSRTVAYSSSGLSAETIHERSTVCTPTCSIGTLATTTNVTFDPGAYTDVFQPTNQPFLVPAVQSQRVTSRGVKHKPAKLYELLMVSSGRTAIATPSSSDSDTDGFAIMDGAAPPAPPSS